MMLNCHTLYAADCKVAIVDFARIINEAPQAAAIDAKITKRFATKKNKLALLRDDLKQSYIASIKDKKFINTEQYFIKIQQYQKSSFELENAKSYVHNEVFEIFYLQLQAIIAIIAKKQGIDVVFMKSIIVYNKPTIDIIDQVIAVLKQG
jgi:Skp family chaperone for outer membrane proteins